MLQIDERRQLGPPSLIKFNTARPGKCGVVHTTAATSRIP